MFGASSTLDELSLLQAVTTLIVLADMQAPEHQKFCQTCSRPCISNFGAGKSGQYFFCAPGRGDKRISSSTPRTEQSSSSRALTSDITHPTSIIVTCFTLPSKLVDPEWEFALEKISEGASAHGNLVVGIT